MWGRPPSFHSSITPLPSPGVGCREWGQGRGGRGRGATIKLFIKGTFVCLFVQLFTRREEGEAKACSVWVRHRSTETTFHLPQVSHSGQNFFFFSYLYIFFPLVESVCSPAAVNRFRVRRVLGQPKYPEFASASASSQPPPSSARVRVAGVGGRGRGGGGRGVRAGAAAAEA